MKSKQQIEAELERVKKIEKEFEGSNVGTDGHAYWVDAFHMRQTLEWVLDI